MSDQFRPVTPIDRSITISATTSTQLMAANPIRKGARFQAPVAADLFWSDTGTVATSTSVGVFKLSAGTAYEFPVNAVSNAAINVYCATGSIVVPATEYTQIAKTNATNDVSTI